MDREIGQLVLNARSQSGLKQEDLGPLMGLDGSQVSRIESGERILTAEELLTLTLIFQDWFEFQSENLMDDLTANLAARLNSFLETATFKPEQNQKQDYLNRLRCRLDKHYGSILA